MAEHHETWPLEYASQILKLPRVQWAAEVQKVPEHLRAMVRQHLQIHVDRMKCRRAHV